MTHRTFIYPLNIFPMIGLLSYSWRTQIILTYLCIPAAG